MNTKMSAAGPPQGANSAPSGAAQRRTPQAWGDQIREFNFDGIPGPTHNYSGLAQGNLASERNANLAANPREAALQGLAKMRALAQMGVPQAVLPPHERPAIDALRALGFAGSDAAVISRAAREARGTFTLFRAPEPLRAAPYISYRWQSPEATSTCASPPASIRALDGIGYGPGSLSSP